MKNLSIVRITPKTFNKFYSLFKKLLETQFPEYSSEIISWIINNPRGHNRARTEEEITKGYLICLGAFLDNNLVGFCFGLPTWGGVSTIYWLAVEPAYQKKGIGKKLLSEWEIDAKSQGGHTIHLNTDDRNLEFYKKSGYEIIGYEPKSYFGVGDYMLTKLIQEPVKENYLR